jgi:hypothetical protein
MLSIFVGQLCEKWVNGDECSGRTAAYIMTQFPALLPRIETANIEGLL